MATKYFYHKNIYNYFLGKSKLIKAMTLDELDEKIEVQREKWKEEEKKLKRKLSVEDKIKRALRNTQDAKERINQFESILNDSLKQKIKIDFNDYMVHTEFEKFEYVKEEISLEDIFRELNVPEKSFLEWFSENRLKKRLEAEENAKQIYENRIIKANEDYELALSKYNFEKQRHIESETKLNNDITRWKKDYEECKKLAVERYFNEVLSKSNFPKGIEKEFLVQYDEKEKLLIVEFKIPEPDSISNIIEYKFVKMKDEIEAKFMKQKDFDKYYEDIIYQITLKTIYEIFSATESRCINQIIFNGRVDYIDKSTGKDVSSYIISLKVNRDDFIELELNRINYKECIKGLKGVFAGKLISCVPIRPILNINREDKRFVDGREILVCIDDGTNLASMEWEDFEHLVRELFERKYNREGVEVKITQASRDGGVDAVIYDSDPFNGGKFIIQTKRYNNIVPIAAVRELYATVMDEHATRGILVTTSNYGADSYDYIKDKQITLINGNELLGLFNEVGYSSLRIELWEERKGGKFNWIT